MRFLVFDTETTGLPKTKFISPSTLDQWPHIVQFSYVIYDSSLNCIVETKDYLIHLPENVIITEELTNIHGITNEMSRTHGYSLHDVLNEFMYHLKESDQLIGHNIAFDLNMIKVEMLRTINLTTLPKKKLKMAKNDFHFINNYNNIICTLKESVLFCGIEAVNKYGKTYLKFPKLSELHQKLFNTIPNHLHNSFNDVLITLRCFMKLIYNVDLLSHCEQFANLTASIYDIK